MRVTVSSDRADPIDRIPGRTYADVSRKPTGANHTVLATQESVP
jgi:hypothetical protein